MKIFKKPQEQNCAALLAFVSLLWCTEALPLYITSALIPLLAGVGPPDPTSKPTISTYLSITLFTRLCANPFVVQICPPTLHCICFCSTPSGYGLYFAPLLDLCIAFCLNRLCVGAQKSSHCVSPPSQQAWLFTSEPLLSSVVALITPVISNLLRYTPMSDQFSDHRHRRTNG